jgi:PLP dependent protein
LARELAENGRFLPTFLEVNVSGEASKAGFLATDWEGDVAQQAALRTAMQTLAALPGLELHGLMTMAPWHAPQSEIRAVFQRARALADWLNRAQDAAQITWLSMGMTDDFELAIEEGATHVRVGRAIFGERG